MTLLERLVVLLMIGLLSSGCGAGKQPVHAAPVRFTTTFESGSLGPVTPLASDGLSWELALRNDNGDAPLPTTYRTWWYTRAEGVPVGARLHLEFSGLGFREFVVPVYSYDGKRWQYFDERDVKLVPIGPTATGADRLVVEARFDASTVWIARTFPYTTADLSAFLQSLGGTPYLRIDLLGASPRFQLPIQLLTVQDPTGTGPRETVWIHARTHPAETGPSYLLEGLLRAVVAEDALGRSLRARYIFKVVPMHNPDGVFLGNYRTTATSVNLETKWLATPGSPTLNPAAPPENLVVNGGAMAPVALDAQAPVVLALNLHSSNSGPDAGAFCFPHFGSDPAKYSPAQQNLWRKQLAFIEQVALAYDGRFEQPPAEGGAGFLNTAFPETWWWSQKQDAVNAMTLETTYGRAGFDHWVTQDDLRALGRAVATAINNLRAPPPTTKVFRLPFKPELYTD